MTALVTTRKGTRVSVSRDGQPVGYAARAGEQWTAFVFIAAAPFETVRTGFASADEAVAFIGANGTTPDYMRKDA